MLAKVHEYQVRIEPIIDAQDFWFLVEAFIDDSYQFDTRRNDMVDAFKSRRLYGLRVQEQPSHPEDPLLTSDFLLPLFCICESSVLFYIWVHPKNRGNGYSRLLIEKLRLKEVVDSSRNRIRFWNRLNLRLR